MLSKIKSTRKQHLVYCLFAVFYFWMAAQIPYTHDDWDWGLDIGLHQLIHATVNSRYAGNFFVVIMTRSELLKTFIMGSGYFLIPFCLSHFAAKLIPNTSKNTKLMLFLLANCLLLTINRGIWRQTYGWVSGYANFVVSAIFMMLWINEIISVSEPDAACKKTSVTHLFLYFLLSVTSQLFLENLALFHVILGIFLCVYHYIQHRKIPGRILVMVIGSIIGLIIMFSSSLYDTLLSTGYAVGDYRQIPALGSNSISQFLYLTVRSMLFLGTGLYAGNYVICMFILLCLCRLITKHPRIPSVPWRKWLIRGNITCSVALTACRYLTSISAEINNLMHAFNFLVSVSFFLLTTVELILLFKSVPQTLRCLLILWLSAPMLIAPLLVTTECGSRLFFSSNLFLILISLVLLGHSIPKSASAFSVRVERVIAVTAAVLLIFHGFIYAQIGSCKQARNTKIAETLANEHAEVILPAFPFADYLHIPDPNSDYRVDYFKEFYGIPQHVDVIFETAE